MIFLLIISLANSVNKMLETNGIGCKAVMVNCVASWIAVWINEISTGSPTATLAFNLETLLSWMSRVY